MCDRVDNLEVIILLLFGTDRSVLELEPHQYGY